MSPPWSSHDAGIPESPTDADLDTIGLLQEEIVRLEEELRLRDEAAVAEHAASRSMPARQDERDERDEAAEEKLRELSVALHDREETIALILEQLRLGEEAEAASRAEWEQLNRWVQEVEQRVAEQADSKPDAGQREALEAEQRSHQAFRQAAEKEQRAWEIQRLALVGEVERLRSHFSQSAGESDAAYSAVQALESENGQLRQAYEELARNSAPNHEFDAIVAELQSVRQECEALDQQLKQTLDHQQRERNEHEAAVNALRTQLTREAIRRQEAQRTGAEPSAGDDPMLDPDVRIRAFREHLKKIHDDEAQERMKRSLSSRLSRLWHHTGPNS